MRLVPFVLVAACAGPSLSPDAPADWEVAATDTRSPVPAIVLSEPTVLIGETVEFTVTGDLAHGEEAHLLISYAGLGDGPCPAVVGGLCMDIVQTVLAGSAEVDEGGVATIAFDVPAEVPADRVVGFQAAVVRGVGGRNSIKSNAVERVTTPVILGCTDPGALDFDPEATVDDGSCSYAEVPIETFGWDGNSGHLIHGYGTGTPEDIAYHFCLLNGYDVAVDWTLGNSGAVDTCYCIYSPPGDVVSPCCSGVASRNVFLGPIVCE